MPTRYETAGIRFRPEQLRKARLLAGYTQETLAFKANMATVTIQKYEQGHRDNPSPSTLKRLARALGQPVDFFLEEAEDD